MTPSHYLNKCPRLTYHQWGPMTIPLEMLDTWITENYQQPWYWAYILENTGLNTKAGICMAFIEPMDHYRPKLNTKASAGKKHFDFLVPYCWSVHLILSNTNEFSKRGCKISGQPYWDCAPHTNVCVRSWRMKRTSWPRSKLRWTRQSKYRQVSNIRRTLVGN